MPGGGLAMPGDEVWARGMLGFGAGSHWALFLLPVGAPSVDVLCMCGPTWS